MDQVSNSTNDAMDKIYVYEAPVRIWHWVNMLTVLVLGVTGYFIGNPLPSMISEASDYGVMSTIRFLHFSAAYIFAIGFLVRIYWAIVGNQYARELFVVPFWKAKWRQQCWSQVKWYAFLKPSSDTHVGHNPLTQIAMFFFVVLLSLLMIFTGFALYGEDLGMGSWADALFGWMIPLFGQSQDVHVVHRLGFWLFMVFVMVHVYISIREDILSKQTMISTMINGWRFFK